MKQIKFKGGTPLHVLTLLSAHKSKSISHNKYSNCVEYAEYVLSQAYFSAKMKTYIHNFRFPGSLMSAIQMLSNHPITNIEMPNKGDVKSQIFISRVRKMSIIPIMTLIDEKGLRWILSFDTKNINDPRCYFLAKCKNERKSLDQLGIMYNRLKKHEIPWQTIWECLSDMINGSGI